jgi:hypothetical protein
MTILLLLLLLSDPGSPCRCSHPGADHPWPALWHDLRTLLPRAYGRHGGHTPLRLGDPGGLCIRVSVTRE